jgi:FkbM family methyltransferase
MFASYDGYTYVTDDPIFQEYINVGQSEPYPKQLSVVQRYLKMFPHKNRTYIDVGAHIGTTIMPYSKMFSSIVGYEPSSRNFPNLEVNIRNNNINHCTIHNVGLYDSDCRGDIVQHGENNSGCYFFQKNPDGEIHCKTLDSAEHNEVDFIKLDTEGSEYFVLRGACKTLLKWKPLIQFECNGLSEKLYGVKKHQVLDYLYSLGYILFDTSDENNIFLYCPQPEPYSIYCFWTGSNPMSDARKECLDDMAKVTDCNINLITPEHRSIFELQSHPFHPAFEYLSETHKADFLRSYFMHFYGGGYSDIKKQSGSWRKSFDENAIICGYPEIEGGVAVSELSHMWSQLIGNGAYIVRPNTFLTKIWYARMIQILDTKLDELRLHPAKFPQDRKELGNGYPIEWNEMLGRIFHKVCSEHIEVLHRSLPIILLSNYR